MNATTRMALRSIRRDRRRSLLIVALMAVPVAIAVVVAAAWPKVNPTAQDNQLASFGQAEWLVEYSAPSAPPARDLGVDVDPYEEELAQSLGVSVDEMRATTRRLSAVEPEAMARALRGEFGTDVSIVTRSWDRNLRGVYSLGLDVADPLNRGIIDLRDGRAPEVGEVLISPRLAERLDATIGDTVDLGPDGERQVVGLARARGVARGQTVIFPAGEGAAPDASVTLLIGATGRPSVGTQAAIADVIAGEVGGSDAMTFL